MCDRAHAWVLAAYSWARHCSGTGLFVLGTSESSQVRSLEFACGISLFVSDTSECLQVRSLVSASLHGACSAGFPFTFSVKLSLHTSHITLLARTSMLSRLRFCRGFLCAAFPPTHPRLGAVKGPATLGCPLCSVDLFSLVW